MYRLEEQETVITLLEMTGEVDVYSCTPRIVEQMMKVAAKNRLPILVMDIVKGKPKAVQMKVFDFSIVDEIKKVV